MNNYLLLATSIILHWGVQACAFSLNEVRPIVSLGVFNADPGKTQHINIIDLIGNEYTTTKNSTEHFLFGVGYFLHEFDKGDLSLFYGINGFYLSKTTTKGAVIQEGMFYNLSYQYKTSNLPIYASAKAVIKNDGEQYALVMDAGIGPNFMKTSNYNENSLDGGITIPDHAFLNETNTQFSATAGLGIRLNHFWNKAPIELAYRFFYLGQGELNPRTTQILDSLKTGNNYANSLVLSVVL